MSGLFIQIVNSFLKKKIATSYLCAPNCNNQNINVMM